MAESGSMLNTPPTFAWYIADLVFQWIEARGGLAAMAEHNRTKAERTSTPRSTPPGCTATRSRASAARG
ncbi:phosphoserine aminotransferase [mine drainage metagenome]|uniref:Phosphoserine aminotransferase n=1 Tax=mine drainage metagenome TaxID=410659 RepID=T0Y794_9ZZZZ